MPKSITANDKTAKNVVVSISSSFEINGQLVTVNSQNINEIKKGIKFSLSQPVALGSINDFLDWLNKTFGVPLTAEDLDKAINNIPDSPEVVKTIKDALKGILSATITITVLSLDTETGIYRFAVTMKAEPPISVLNLLKLESIGVEISAGQENKPEEKTIN
ncbi:TPA: hypothetical protein PNO53_002963 [Salmonella enterica]|nr:hypothetical protein [Salmonella enterica]